MDRDYIRRAIAEDLRGKPTRNPLSLAPTIAEKCEVKEEDVWNQLHQMCDIGHVLMRNETSIRLLEGGERHYFSSKEERATHFLSENWPHITSNVIALLSLVIAGFALWSK